MEIPQRTYNMYFTAAILGMQAIAGETCRKISKAAKGIVYYGRAVVQSRLYDKVCRLPRENYFVMTTAGGTTWTAGSISSVIVHGYKKDGDVAADTASKTVTTAWVSNMTATLAAHAVEIAAALDDCVTCVASGTATITYTGDCEDIISVTTTVVASGAYDSSITATSAIGTADTVDDIIGVSYLTHDRQQQLNTGYTYYMDTEEVNIMVMGTVWVYSEEAVSPASDPYARLIHNSTYYSGYFGKSGDSSKCVDLEGTRFGETITAAGLVPLTINLPN